MAVGDILSVNGVLVGQVSEVFNRYAVARTVFEPGWEFPVYIGNSLTRGLFNGGAEPKITLISRAQRLSVGDVVISADPTLLMPGLAIGSVTQVTGGDSSPFWEAFLSFPYSVSDLRQVEVFLSSSPQP